MADASKNEVVKVRARVLSAGVTVNYKVYNLSGELVKNGSFTSTAAGWNDADWNLTNNDGKKVGQGLYFVRIEAEGRADLRKVFIIK